MSDTNGKEAVVVTVDRLTARLQEKEAALDKIKAQIENVEKQMVRNQQQLQAAKDQLMTQGLELQGQIKELRELTGVSETPVTPAQ